MGYGTPENEVPVVIPVNKPVSLIPVGVKEAGLDSPTFRASATHLSDQVDAVEKWLDGLVKITTRLVQEAATLGPLLNSFAAQCRASQNLSEAILDHDYTLLALKRLSEGSAQDFWSRAVESVRKTQSTIAEPIKQFLQTEIRPFKEARRSLDNTQKTFDGLLLRYASQNKTKEASSLREDAFQMHEARRAYLKASMDFCVLAPQVRAALDNLLIKISCDQWDSMKHQRQPSGDTFNQYTREMERIKSWSKDMLGGERFLRHQLLTARRQIEEDAEAATRPSRELDDYSASTVPYLGSGPPPKQASAGGALPASSKQGWLFLRTITGKPARTSWVRRWFFVKNGIFGCLVQGARSGGVEESEKIGVLLCGVRAAFQEERRFCFEVKTKDTTILLQAETQKELMDWMSAFDEAKQKAIEEPTAVDSGLASSGNPSSDAAFAVNPAISQELATKRADGQVITMTEDPTAILLMGEGDTTADLATQSSFDVSSLRRQGPDRETDGSRDHTSRILQKLGKATASPQLGSLLPGSQASAGGISSLIAASHNAMPIGPGVPQVQNAARSFSQPSAPFSNTLAPSTLVNPPSTTNLTKTAIRVGVDRGLDLGVVDERGGIPSSLMANQWGSANYGHISRLERGEVDTSTPTPTPTVTRRASDPTENDDRVLGAELNRTPSGKRPASPQQDSSRHHKSASVMSLPGIHESSSFIDYPSFYPAQLRAHDAQFRMLFPNVSQLERVIMVFRSSWTVADGQQLPGRIFVTPKELYFYSNHMGLVLVSGAPLERISEVQVARGSANDNLYLDVRDSNGHDDALVLKIFLESPRLIQHRIEYLVSNSASEEPDDLETVLKNLVQVEVDLRAETASSEAEDMHTRRSPQRQLPENPTRVRVDRSLPMGGNAGNMIDPSDVARFKLPSQPINYIPNGMSAAPTAEKIFDVSAKALLHIIYGDKSAVCPVLYQQRGAQTIRQHPWAKADNDSHYQRSFEYDTEVAGAQDGSSTMSVIDSQSLDVASDHLCYVVTDLKVPSHLPRPKDYTLVSKVVITYEAKNKCRLAIYTKVDWINAPWFSKTLIERRALEDLELEAVSMTTLVAEQVQRLGSSPATKRIVEIFGNIGQQAEAAQVSSKDDDSIVKMTVRRRTMTGLFVENVRSLFQSCCTTVLMTIIGMLNIIFKSLSANVVLITLLLISLSLSVFQSSEFASTWWHDRSTATFMARLGVVPNMSMSKGIYLKDVADSIGLHRSQLLNASNECSIRFSHILSHTPIDGPASSLGDKTSPSTRSTARRLRRTRQRLATYRHDILVALRLVNSIERDTMQAEYENWILEENAMCSRVSALFQPSRGDGKEALSEQEGADPSANTGRLVKRLGTTQAVKVDQWYASYCASCRSEQAQLGLSTDL